jgi:hypothetical protein
MSTMYYSKCATVALVAVALLQNGNSVAARDKLRFTDCSPQLEANIAEAYRVMRDTARNDRAKLLACMDEAYLVEHDRRSPATIVGYLTRADVTKVICRNLDDASASARRIYLDRSVMNIDRGFAHNADTKTIAAVMAHETMHNNGLNHKANDLGSKYYQNTVPEQIQACYQWGKPNNWPGPGKPRYVPADIVGIGIDMDNNWSFAWSKDGTVAAGSTTRIHNYRVPYPYQLPNGYTPADIVEMGVDGEKNWTFAWFRDGMVSAGTTESLSKFRKPYRYRLPSGYTAADIVGIGIDGENDWVFVWFKDGKVSAGTSDDLDRHRKPYAYKLPAGYTPADIVAMDIDGDNNWCYAWYKDGKVSAGTSDNLAAHRQPETVITGR